MILDYRHFIKKCKKSLLQHVSGFSLKNASVLLQNTRVVTEWDDVIVVVYCLLAFLLKLNKTYSKSPMEYFG